MSGAACSNLLLKSPSPSSKHRQTSSDTSELFNKFIHVDSPRSSPSLFKRPSPSPTNKWKAALAHLSAPRLLPVPASFRSARSRRPLRPTNSVVTVPIDDTAAVPDVRPAPTPIHIATPAIPPVNGPIDIIAPDNQPFPTPIDIADPDIQPTANRTSQVTSGDPSLSTTNDIPQLLHILTNSLHANAHTNVTVARLRALAALCSLCVFSQSNADLCVAAGGIDIILTILNGTRDAHTTMDVTVEESEKALLLLQLLTSSSVDGCAAALQQSSLTIATLGKKLLRVSEACTASAIAVLTVICKHPEAAPFCKAISETAIPSKLVVVLQVASKDSTKRRAGRLLRLLGDQQQLLLQQAQHSS